MQEDQKPKKFSISNLLRNSTAHSEPKTAREGNAAPAPAAQGHRSHEDNKGLPPQPQIAPGLHPVLQTDPAAASVAPTPPTPDLPPQKTETIHAQPPPRTEMDPVYYGQDTGHDQESVDLFRYISILLRRRKIIVASCLAFFLFALFTSLQKPKVYTAKTQILYKPFRSNDVIGGSDSYELWMDRENQLTTFEQIILAPEIMKRLAKELSMPMEASALPGMIKVTRIEKSSILEIVAQHRDPDFSAEVANKLVSVFIQYNTEVNTEDITRTIRKLEDQIAKTGTELREKEDNLRRFQELNQFVRATEETQLEVRKLSELEIQLQNANLQIQETRKRLEKIREELRKRNVDVKLESELTQLELDVAVSKSKYGEEHPRTIGAKQKIGYLKTLIEQQKARHNVEYSNDPVRVSLVQELTKQRTDYVGLETSRVALMEAIAAISANMEKLPAKELEQVRLMREKQSVEDVYGLLKRKFEESKIQRDAQSSGLIQIERAVVPENPVSSRRLYTVLIGVLVGLTIGTGIAFLLEYLDQSIKGIADLESHLKLPLLGGIPGLDSEQTDLAHGIGKETLLEPYRIIRTNLQYAVPGLGAKVLVITSAMQGEGKSSKSSKLAVSFALTGKKVLLIDGDLRRASQHAIFGVDRGRGLSEYLTGQLPLSEVIKPTTYTGLMLMTAGLKPPNPAELLGSETMDQLLRQARQEFEIIIIDTPASLPVTDASVLAPKADGVILILQAFRTPIKAAQHVRSTLDRLGCRIVGCIINRIPQNRGYSAYYYYSYYGYGYRYGYHDYYSDEPKPVSGWGRAEEGIVFLRRFASALWKETSWSQRWQVLRTAQTKRPQLVRFTFLTLLCVTGLLVAWAIFPLDSGFKRSTGEVIFEAPAVSAAPDLSGTGTGKAVEDLAFGAKDSMSPPETLGVTFDTAFSNWRQSFAANDAKPFLDSYAREGLQTPVGDFTQWELYMQKRFQEKPNQDVAIGGVTVVESSAEKMSIEFPITIRSASSVIQTSFHQVWIRFDRRWLIIRERILP